ncbi:MAG: tetratricopeptide repeat protein [Spirochaetia bacterium]|nr:tetratricopeptide repeat protein [Spirochaetia bacterium]
MRFGFMLLCLFLPWILPAQDRVVFEGGNEEIGKVLNQTSNDVLFRIKGVEKIIPKNEIKKIELDYAVDKHFLEARELLETSVKRFPDSDANRILLIKAAFKTGDYSNAEKYLAQGRGGAYRLLWIYLTLKRQGGIPALKELARISPDTLSHEERVDWEILNSFALADSGKIQEAGKILRRRHESDPLTLKTSFQLLSRVLDPLSWLKECAAVDKAVHQKESWPALKPNLEAYYRDVNDKHLRTLDYYYPPALLSLWDNPKKKVLVAVSLSSFSLAGVSGLVYGLMEYQTYLARETYKFATSDFDAKKLEWDNAQGVTIGALVASIFFLAGGAVTGILYLNIPEKYQWHLGVNGDLRNAGASLTLDFRF